MRVCLKFTELESAEVLFISFPLSVFTGFNCLWHHHHPSFSIPANNFPGQMLVTESFGFLLEYWSSLICSVVNSYFL